MKLSLNRKVNLIEFFALQKNIAQNDDETTNASFQPYKGDKLNSMIFSLKRKL